MKEIAITEDSYWTSNIQNINKILPKIYTRFQKLQDGRWEEVTYTAYLPFYVIKKA
jgi:hypothetical protein